MMNINSGSVYIILTLFLEAPSDLDDFSTTCDLLSFTGTIYTTC